MDEPRFSLKYLGANWQVILVCLSVGIAVGFAICAYRVNHAPTLETKQVRAPDMNYKLINPLLGLDNPEATNYGHMLTFKNKMNALVNDEIAQKNASSISVYYRSADSGRWFGINEDETFTPASLLKVPIMIAYYNLAESQPGILSGRLTFTGPNDAYERETILPSQELVSGKSYTIDDLISRMIKYSDNDAMLLLYSNIDSKLVDKVYADLNITLPKSDVPQDFLKASDYSFFLRVLYGSTYLSHADSEKVLDLLSQSEFKDGLVAGVPVGTVVAHKFGEYVVPGAPVDGVAKQEFHDCGIIYHPKKPYILCVMTKGDNLASQEKAVAELSKLAFDEVTNGGK